MFLWELDEIRDMKYQWVSLFLSMWITSFLTLGSSVMEALEVLYPLYRWEYKFIKVWFNVFHCFEIILDHDLFKYSFCSIFSLLRMWLQSAVLYHPQLLWAPFLSLCFSLDHSYQCIFFFFSLLRQCIFLSVHWFAPQLCKVWSVHQRNASFLFNFIFLI